MGVVGCVCASAGVLAAALPRACVCAGVLAVCLPEAVSPPTVNEQEDSRFGARNWAPLNVRSADGRGLGVAAAADLSGGSFSFRIARIIESGVSNDLNKSNA